MSFVEHYKRSIAKTITYRVLILVSTYAIIYSFTGDKNRSVDITIVSNLSSTLIYFLHERLWNKNHWGKQSHKHKS